MKDVLAKVMNGERLTEDDAGRAMSTVMDGQATPAQIGGLLAGLAARGETEDEIVGFARTMRARAVALTAPGAIDTCGTGGDGARTFNISTVASLVAAACGVPVAKHGNRSSSGGCGSADVLEALGVCIDAPVATTQRSFDQVGWAFLFAPAFHASTRHAVLPRKELGARSAFNLLGPLTNPAHPEAQVVGVPRAELLGLVAACLGRLGTQRAWVVHGSGLDEISIAGETSVAALEGGKIRAFTVSPEDAGLRAASLEDLRCATIAESATRAREVLGGARGPCRDVVVLNAAAALVVAGRVPGLREGARESAEAIDDGRAARLLGRVIEVSQT
jgi:anthranilate phosphoribosyltransferase